MIGHPPMSFLDELNPAQRAAASHPGGPMLILAGAGSGKTRVIVYRVASLLEGGVPAERILGVTFTNKAAGEMRERVLRLLGESEGSRRAPWLGTFHSWCLRMLRIEVARTDLRPGFVVYDQDDARSVVKACQRELAIDDKTHLPQRVVAAISRAKGAGLGPDEHAARVPPGARDRGSDAFTSCVAQVYPLYQKKLVEANACDFDDLLMRAVRLFEEDEVVRAKYQERIEHLLVDEYQDTNPLQYRLIRLLAGRHPNTCAVGDEDQSIYRFRGADISNILNFERDFPGTRVFRIEQNYRSSGNILGAANGVVARNTARKGKILWTENDDGAKVLVRGMASDLEEADWISREVQRAAGTHGAAEVAVMYRTNAQSRPFEEALSRLRVPYLVVGGMRFYERREVKDILAYARLLLNTSDDVALERIVNVPTRGIGRGALEAVRSRAQLRGTSLWTAIVDGLADDAYPGRAHHALDGFVTLIEDLRGEIADAAPPWLLRQVIEKTGYLKELEKEGPTLAEERRQNLQELVSAATQHHDRDPGGGLEGFLADVALASDQDDLAGNERVALLTMHAAKGLEFEVVFVAGMERGLFPREAAEQDQDELEEERRLCYVAMTRARTRLVLTHAARRVVFGQIRPQEPSLFLREIPAEHATIEGGAPAARTPGVPGRLASREALASFFGSAEIPVEEMSQEAADDEPAWNVDAGTEDAPADVELKRGDRVRHASFGVGRILKLEKAPGRTMLTVYFEARARTVKLVEEFAKLQRV